MGEHIGIRILIAVGLASALVAVRGAGPAVLAGLYVAAVTVPLSVADARTHRLPNALVLPGYLFATVGLAWEALGRGSPSLLGGPAGALSGPSSSGRPWPGPGDVGWSPGWPAGWESIVVPIGGSGLVVAGLLLLSCCGGLGMGDVKLGGLLALALAGAASGPSVWTLVWLGAAFGAVALHATIEVATTRAGGGGARAVPGGHLRQVAFGPALLGAFWVVVLVA
ncbi:hypothetical protein [Leifsonia aquatica]|uniref:hypothetical protein n=1 Tax=Leifsonia aquatica TaxID=144185 RepID=UPI00046875FC|nr:hypothetical protein [Leifsonia aquatica]